MKLLRLALFLLVLAFAGAFLFSALKTTGAERIAVFGSRVDTRGDVAVPLVRVSQGELHPTFVARLEARSLPAHTSGLDLLFSFPRARKNLQAKLVEEAAPSCVWRPEAEGNVRTGDRVTFRRQEGCAPVVEGATGRVAFRLEVFEPDLASLSLVALPNTDTGRSEAGVVLLEGTERLLASYTRGPSEASPRSRLSLLAFHWDASVKEGTNGLGLLVVALVVMLCSGAGVLLFPLPMRAARSATVGFLLVVAPLFGLWIVATPPLQAPDEPDHLMSGFRVAESPAAVAKLDAALSQEAKRVHFERLKFQRAETFNAADALQPYPLAWSAHVAPFDLAGRSALEAALFRAWRPPAFDASGGSLFGYLRDLRLLIAAWALACAFGCGWVLTRVSLEDTPAGFHAALLLFALLPAVPQFVTHVSNYGFLIGSLVLVLGAASIRPRTERQGVLKFAAFGLALAFCCLSGRIGLTALVLLPLASLWKPSVPSVSAWKVWAVAFVAFAAPLLFAKTQSFAFLGQGFAVVASFAPNLPANVFLLAPVFLGCVVLAGVDTLLAQKAELRPHPAGPPLSDVVKPTRSDKALFLSLAAVLSFILVVSYFVPLSGLRENEDVDAVRGLAYVWEVLPRFVRSLGISDPEYFLSSSFWSGFGWLDTLFPRRLVRVLKCLPIALAFAALAGWWWRSDGKRPAVFLVACWALGLGIVSLEAFAISFERVNLHGRYLSLPFLVLTAGAVLPLAMGRANRALQWLPTKVLVVFALCLQFHSLRFVLERFFP